MISAYWILLYCPYKFCFLMEGFLKKEWMYFIKAITATIEEQTRTTKAWHVNESDSIEKKEDTLLHLVLTQHLMNYKLWHTEDIARRKDVDSSVIADCKYTIDRYNQERNNYMEQIDDYCVRHILPMLPRIAKEEERYNSETIGMIIDRLSILALKVYHMEEESERLTATEEHRTICKEKTKSLQEQRERLIKALLYLLQEYSEGKKYPFVYLQHKMYNDPNLNPQLYSHEKK